MLARNRLISEGFASDGVGLPGTVGVDAQQVEGLSLDGVGRVVMVKVCSGARAVETVLRARVLRSAISERKLVTGVPTSDRPVRTFAWAEGEGTAGATMLSRAASAPAGSVSW